MESDRTQRRHRILGPVFASTALLAASSSLVIVVLPFRLILELKLSVFDYGVALAAYAAGMLATEAFWGFVAFRLGSAQRIIVLGSVSVAGLVALGFATTLAPIAGSLALIGAFGVATVPLARWLAVAAGGPGFEGRGTGRLGMFFGGGLIGGTALGPLLWTLAGFTPVVVVALALFVASIAVMARLPWPEAELPTVRSVERTPVRSLITPHFLFVSSLVLLNFTAMAFTSNFLQLYSVQLFGGTEADSGWVLGGVRLTTLVASFALGGVVDRWGPSRSTPAGFLLLAAGGAGTWFAHSYVEMALAAQVFAAGLGWLSASLLPLAVGPVARASQGTLIGIFGSVEDLGLLVGPLSFGAAASAFGLSSLFPLVVAIGLGGALLAGLFRSRAAASTLRTTGRQGASPRAPP
jgi:predicted MFS family arabinose efflux permease